MRVSFFFMRPKPRILLKNEKKSDIIFQIYDYEKVMKLRLVEYQFYVLKWKAYLFIYFVAKLLNVNFDFRLIREHKLHFKF